MKVSSAKQKGRLLQQKVRDLILSIFPTLEPDDVRSVSMGAGGEDVQLSPAARKLFNFSVECKNTEKINVWEAFNQAIANTPKDSSPILIFKRNRSKLMVCTEFGIFLELVKKNYELMEKIKKTESLDREILNSPDLETDK